MVPRLRFVAGGTTSSSLPRRLRHCVGVVSDEGLRSPFAHRLPCSVPAPPNTAAIWTRRPRPLRAVPASLEDERFGSPPLPSSGDVRPVRRKRAVLFPVPSTKVLVVSTVRRPVPRRAARLSGRSTARPHRGVTRGTVPPGPPFLIGSLPLPGLSGPACQLIAIERRLTNPSSVRVAARTIRRTLE